MLEMRGANRILVASANNADPDGVRLAFKAGADPRILLVPGEDGVTPMHRLITMGAKDTAVSALAEGGADMDLEIRDPWGRTLLHRTAILGQALIAEALLEKGADPDAEDPGTGGTALHLCALNRSWQAGIALAMHDADPGIKDREGSTPLHWIAVPMHRKAERGLYNPAGLVGWLEVLLERGADVDIPDANGRTPLQVAARNGNEPVVESLLYHGADANRTDAEGRTALLQGLLNNHPRVTELLVQHGADPGIADQQGTTVLDRLNFIQAAWGVDLAEQVRRAAAREAARSSSRAGTSRSPERGPSL
ncbi:ankyrin repeat domain-containing protein [Thiohalorhabdus sp. Cl-TMA]|uniref:Ankyrin repeat domain-containing protein n=1 Tax=Thiohalorhabdus methylotrophus TaxID=3242694 RepID=A0ABV4TVD8_9GAMM